MSDTALHKIDRVLVATGLSQESVGGVRAAQALAARFDAELHVIHVIEPVTGVAREAMPDVAEAASAHERRAFEEFVSANGLGNATLHAVEGNAETEILGAIDEHMIDLVVIGRYGKGGPKPGRLGSVAHRIARSSPVTVLIADPATTEPPARIGVATAFSEQCDVLVKRGVALANLFGIDTVQLLHAFELPRGYHAVMSEEEAESKLRELAEVRMAFAQREYADPAGVRLELHSGRGDARNIVPVLASEAGTDLVVVGTHSRSAAAMFMLNRTTEAILNNVGCSVWATKRPEWYEGFVKAVAKFMGA